MPGPCGRAAQRARSRWSPCPVQGRRSGHAACATSASAPAPKLGPRCPTQTAARVARGAGGAGGGGGGPGGAVGAGGAGGGPRGGCEGGTSGGGGGHVGGWTVLVRAEVVGAAASLVGCSKAGSVLRRAASARAARAAPFRLAYRSTFSIMSHALSGVEPAAAPASADRQAGASTGSVSFWDGMWAPEPPELRPECRRRKIPSMNRPE